MKEKDLNKWLEERIAMFERSLRVLEGQAAPDWVKSRVDGQIAAYKHVIDHVEN